MLKKLTIQNVALIPHLELEFCDQLNIMSGETGAGKSIIVDSLMLLLGMRYDKTLLRFGQKSGFVEGVFDSTQRSDAVLNELGFDTDDILIITRKFYEDGKNEIRLNGRAATTGMLKQLTAMLVDIYGQNEYQSLTKQSEHLKILDYYVRRGAESIKERLKKNFLDYKEVVKQLAELGDLSERERNMDLLRFQIEEIEKAKIKPNEEDELLTIRKKIASAEKINVALSTLVGLLSEQEDGGTALELIGSSLKAMGTVSELSTAYGELYERLNSVLIEVEDIADCARNEMGSLNFDFNDLEKLEKRLELIRSLKRKYGDFEKMLEFEKQSEELLYKLENCTELYEKLNKEKEELIKTIFALSQDLHKIRSEGAKDFQNRLIAELSDLGMVNCAFEINFEPLPKLLDCEHLLSANGLDKAEFYLSPNKGQPLKPLIKIISGGEMSRFMLALKVISSQTDDIPTMIFDEIDTGISGKIGQEVAKKLAAISRRHQILCVTHLSQIASMADNHYFISKDSEAEQTVTTVTLLTPSGMTEEISRLSGAKDISSQSNDNALQMKKWSDLYKISLQKK